MSRLAAAAPWAASFLLIISAYSFFVPPPGPNELSRYDLLLALARDHTVVADRYCANTMDLSSYEGHCYSNKSIGPSLLGLPLWWLADRFYGFGEYGQVRTDFPLWVVTTGVVSVPSALLALLLYWVARELSGSHRRALATAGAYAFGTIAFPFSAILYGHQTGAAFAFAAFAAAFCWQRQGKPSPGLLVIAGFLGGWAVLTEYPAAIIVGLIGAYILALAAGRRQWWAYVAGLGLGLLPLALYNTIAFGRPWRLSYAFSFADHSAGVFGITFPRLQILQEITIGDLGLFVRSPLLALAIVGFGLWWRSGCFRREALLCGGASAAFLLYNASYYTALGGGYPIGPRFLVPVLPFMALGLAFLPGRAWWVAGPLALASALSMLMIIAVLPMSLIGDPRVAVPYWWEHLRTGQLIPTWGSLRYGLDGPASLSPLLLIAAAGLALWLVHTRLASNRAPFAGLALAVAAYGAMAMPPGSVPVLFVPPPMDVSGARPLSIVYGDRIELLGYRLDREVARPGDRLALTLYWRSRAPMNEDYTVFIHLLGRDADVLGGWDIVPGAGAFPTRMWTPGRTVAETYYVPLSENIATPTLCRVEVGLYQFATGQRLTATTEQGVKLGTSALVTRIGLPGARPDGRGTTVVEADFGGQVALLGYRLDNSDGAHLRGKLYWRAEQDHPDRDYTVFVQALRDGKVTAQWDSQPLGGRYPTSLWSRGEVVEDWFDLPLGGDARQGITLVAGLYDLGTMQRLSAGDTSYVELR